MEKIIKIYDKVLMRKYNTGVAEDDRSVLSKSFDYTYDEVYNTAVSSIDFTKLPANPTKSYKLRNQNGSGSCVAQSVAKALEVWDEETNESYSATPVYQKRVNRPNAGMIGQNAFEIAIKSGTGYEKDIASQLMNDIQMDELKYEMSKLVSKKPSNFFIISNNTGYVDPIKLANSVLQNKQAVIFIRANWREWTRQPNVHIPDDTLRHAVCVVEILYRNGQLYYLIEDSWGKFGGITDFELFDGQRVLSAAFIEKHCFFAGGFINLKYKQDLISTKYTFTKPMSFGEINLHVKNLQLFLKSVGCFPANQNCTGVYKGITRTAVKKFQIEYKVATLEEIKALNGMRVGIKTIEVIHKVQGV